MELRRHMSTGIASRIVLTSCWILFLQFFPICLARQIGSLEPANLPSSSSIHSSAANGRPVTLEWGISELSTPLGRVFNFTIPKEAFDGEIVDIKVTEANHASLPNWLTFDAASRLFTGLPFHTADLGTHYIAVSVEGLRGSSVKDIFNIHVTDSPAESHQHCVSEAAQTILTLLLDVDWMAMTMPQRTELLSKFSNYMDVPVTDLKISSVTGTSSSALFDANAIKTGTGNVDEVKHPGIKLSAIVGCNGELAGKHNEELAKFVDEAAKDGSMARFTGVDVVGWHLTTSKPIAISPQSRLRRQHHLHTPEPSPIVPTMVHPQGSSVIATPYLPPTSIRIEPTANPDVGPTAVYSGIRPSVTLPQEVLPTASYGQETTPELMVPTPPPMPPPTRRPGIERQNLPPTLLKDIGGGQPLVTGVGDLFSYEIPNETWIDQDTPHLDVKLAEESDWLDLVKRNGQNVLIGIPMAGNQGQHQHNLQVNDGINTLKVPFQVKVLPKAGDSEIGYNYEVDVTLNEPHSGFGKDRRVHFAETLQNYYHDQNAGDIVIRAIKSGSTHVVFTNGSLANKKDCNDQAITQSTKRIVDGEKLNPEFRDHFAKAGFKVDKAAVNRIGKCAAGASAEKTSGNDIYISTVVPAVVVSSLLLLACCIACILYKKKKRSSKSTAERDDMFRKPNTPLILPGETNYEKGSNGASKKPITIESERGGTLPPAYSTNPGRQSGRQQRDPEDQTTAPLLQSGRPSSPTHTNVRDDVETRHTRKPPS